MTDTQLYERSHRKRPTLRAKRGDGLCENTDKKQTLILDQPNSKLDVPHLYVPRVGVGVHVNK